MDPAHPHLADPLVGATIGNYVVRHKLGEGGMGAVYLAEHPTIGKRVALKVLHGEFAMRADVVTRFFHEAKAVNDIQHPNIVDIIDFGEVPAGVLTRERLVYFIMEFLGGTSLTEVIRSEAPLAPERALAIALQIADALSASHRCGIVHRDLKPDNVMLVQRGREREFVKLLDFGIAKLTGDQGGSQHRTRAGTVMGTPFYMSPEQCEGRGNVDHRTDVYALGIVLYEMLAGRVPFAGDGFGEVLVQHMTQPPPPFPVAVPPAIEQLVARALAKHPEARFASMDEMMQAMGASPALPISAIAAMQPTLMPRTLPPQTAAATTTLGGAAGQAMEATRIAVEPTVRPRKRGKAGLVAGAAVVAAAIAGAALFATQGKEASSEGPSSSPAAAGEHDVLPTAPPPTEPPPTEPPPTEPPPTTEVAPAQTVTIHVTSRPSGARVLLDGVELGTTPYDLVRDRADSEVTLVIEAEGHEPERHAVSLAGPATLDLELTRERSNKRSRRAERARDVKPTDKKSTTRPADEGGEDDTMDPFKKRGTP